MQIINRKRAISAGRDRPIVSHTVSWLIGAVASMIAMTIVYVAWLGANFYELNQGIAKIKADVDHIHQSTDARVHLGQTSVENDITGVRSEVDNLKHHDSRLQKKSCLSVNQRANKILGEPQRIIWAA